MKNKNSIIKSYCFIISFLMPVLVQAQFNVDCTGQHKNSLFFIGQYFFRIDSVDTNPTAPIILDTNDLPRQGLSINRILSIPGSTEVMYTCNTAAIYEYWNGSTWVSTGHTSGGLHPGGTNQYIFNLDGANGTVYRYDGTSNSVPITTNLPTVFNSIYDLATDTAGNFYILYTDNSGFPELVVYDPNGMPIDSFPVTGTGSFPGAAMTMLGGHIYEFSPGGLKKGTLTGGVMQFSPFPVGFIPGAVFDMASCPGEAIPLPTIIEKLATTIFVYPNPAKDYLNIKAEKLWGKNCAVSIIDITGKKLSEENLRFETSKLTLDISQLKNGIYFLRVQTSEGSFTKKFLKG